MNKSKIEINKTDLLHNGPNWNNFERKKIVYYGQTKDKKENFKNTDNVETKY